MSKLKAIIFFAIVFVCLMGITSFASDDIKLYINGEAVKSDVNPVVINNRTLVPVRSIFEKLGADVTWIGSKKQVIIKSNSVRIVLNVDKTRAYVGDKPVELDVAPTIINSRTVIPVRFVSEILGYDVKWESKTNSVHINTPKYDDEDPIIQKVSVKKNAYSSTVTVDVRNMKRPNITYASNPTRFIADFPDASINGGDSRRRMDTNDITEVRYAEHGDYSRVVIETPADSVFDVSYTKNSMVVKVTTEYVDEEVIESKKDSEGDQEYEDDYDKNDAPVIEKPVIDLSDIDPDKAIIVIDPGHGGADMGAVGRDEEGKIVVKESEANLKIALATQKYLEAEGVNVIMTRTTDVALGDTQMEDLLARSAIANEVGATFFVSIHNNSFSNDTATGTEVLYVSGGVEYKPGISGETLAQNILTPLCQTTNLTNRGLKNSPKIVVLRETTMPAVLVECAFVSNPEDRKLLMDDKSMDDMGYSIASGILETLSQFE